MMIIRLTVLRRIALLVIVFIFISAFAIWNQSPSSSLADLQKTVSDAVSYTLHDATVPSEIDPTKSGFQQPLTHTILHIRSFWAVWSQIFHNTRPLAKGIELSTTAGQTSGTKRTGFRQPPRNHVHLSDEDIISLSKTHADLVFHLQSGDWTKNAAGLYNGTGIVTVAGGEYYGPAIVSLRMLRKTGCTLPVEVFLQNRGEYEEEVCERTLPALNAKCVVIQDFLDHKILGVQMTHYQLKVLAMLFSSFERLLYLDSDSFPLVNPEELFTSEPFKSTGFVSWPDFWVATESPVFWTIAGMEDYPRNLPVLSSESGQLLINKETHIKALLLAAYYNVWGPGWFYPLLSQGALGQGDKETFLAAVVVLDLPWWRVQKPVQAVGYEYGNGRWRGGGMVQYHPGDDLAVHPSTQTSTQEPSTPKQRRRKRQTPAEDNEDDSKIRPAFIHANTPKMNAGHLVDGELVSEGDKSTRVRLWGPKEKAVQMFGSDIEKTVFAETKAVGCELAEVIREWRERKDICKLMEEHWRAVFETE